MASQQEKQEIKKQAKNGQSVNQITKKLGLPKSTVYYHFKKAVGQKQKENQLKIPKQPETQGELCGIFAGDGYFKKYSNGHYTTTITLNYKEEYWKILEEFLTDELGKAPHTLIEEEYNRTRLKYDSKALYSLFTANLDWESDKTFTIRLKDEQFSQDFQIGFLRGLIDTDGYTDDTYRNSAFNTISSSLSKDVSSILSRLDISHSRKRFEDKRENCRDMYRVNIYGNDAIDLTEIIEPRNPKKRCNLARL